MKNCQHPHVGKWIQFKNMSPWKDSELWEDNRSEWRKRFVKIYEILPRKIAVRFAGILQAYWRPLYKRFIM